MSYKVLAEVTTTADTQGIIFAQGSRFGGHALYFTDGKVRYTYNFLGIPPEQHLDAPAPEPGAHIIGVDFKKERAGDHGEFWGTATLHIDDKAVAQSEIRTQPGHFTLCGEGLCIGYDTADAVSSDYRGKFEFTGGEIAKVIFDVADDAYVDVERHYEAALSRD